MARRIARLRLTAARRRLLDRLLEQALDLDGEARRRFVEQCQARAPRLGRWLEKLLDATDEPAGAVDRSVAHWADQALATRQATGAEPLAGGTRLGPWRLLEQVGVGGMGEVYRAERADGSFDMQVAVKLIRSRSELLARLLSSERQTLARLNHPGIARLLDGGTAGDGRPYLVMDWIEGESLDQWLEDHQPSPERCLELFADICDTVAAAHRELIVHGDIKPSNIVITPDERVCLLDFGVARLLDQREGIDLPMALTPGFAAPEQLEGKPISTAADIYSLGALLHSIVFGQTPGKGERRLQPPWDHYPRHRDLIAIIDSAMTADPADRYATANALALELQRLRSDWPIRMRRAGPLERLRWWSRRHRAAALAGLALIFSGIAGVSAVAWQARVASVERDLAQAEAARSEALREHLTLLFREVGSLSEDAEELTARELLDRTAQVADDWLADDRALRQQVKIVLAEIMIALNDYSAAEPLLAGFLDGDQEQFDPLLRSIALQDMAQVHHRRGEVKAGLDLADRAVEILESFPGAHPARLSDVLQVRGRLYRDLGRLQEALTDLSRARELALQVSSSPRPLMARAENNLAITLLIGGQTTKAIRHLEAAEALWLALGREESSNALAVTANLASVLNRIGRSREAEQRLRRVIRLRQAHYGESAAMAAARLALGRLLVVRGALDEAEQQLRGAQDIFARFVGEGTPDYAAALLGLGELAEARDRFGQARAHFSAADDIMRSLLGDAHPYTFQTELSGLRASRLAGHALDASALDELVERTAQAGGLGQTAHAQALCEQAGAAYAQNRYGRGLESAQRCLRLLRGLGLDGWRRIEARALVRLGEEAAGMAPATGALDGLIARLAEAMFPDHPRVMWLHDQVRRMDIDGG